MENKSNNGELSGSIPKQHVLSQLIEPHTQAITSSLNTVFEQLDDELFDLARQCKSNQDQDVYFDGMRNLRVLASSFGPSYQKALNEQLKRFYHSQGSFVFEAVEINTDQNALSLIEGDELEISLAFSDLNSRLEQSNYKELYPLERRLAFIIKKESIEPECSPFSPEAWIQALRLEVEPIDLPLEIKLLFLKKLDQLLFKKIPSILKQLNKILIEAGILPDFKFNGIKRPEPSNMASSDDQINPEPAQNLDSSQLQPDQSGLASYNTPFPSSAQAPHAGQSTQTPSGAMGTAAPNAHHTGSTYASGEQFANTAIADHPAASQLYAPSAHEILRETALYEVVQDLLTESRGQRHSPLIRGIPKEAVPNRSDAHVQDVVSVISILQSMAWREKPETLTQPKNTAQIKQSIANHLLEFETEDNTPVMSELTEDIIDLVGMLFEFILSSKEMDASAKNEIMKLQFPMLKVALMDQAFFSRKDSPPRALLESLADLASDWIEQGERDRIVMPIIRKVVARVLEEFDQNLMVFEELCEEVLIARKKAQDKFARNRERSTETYRGKEKLHLAQAKAEETLKTLTEGQDYSKFIVHFLEFFWKNYLTLTITRHGENSAEWDAAFKLSESLIASFTVQDDETRRELLKSEIESIRSRVHTSLLQTGTFEADAKKMVSELAYVQGWALASEKPGPMPQQMQVVDETAMKKVEQQQAQQSKRRGKEALQSAPKPVEKLKPDEKEMFDQVIKLPFGTWFQYELESGLPKIPTRLAWYSPTTHNCLLVDRNGRTLSTRHVLVIVRDILDGRCQIKPASKNSLLERAMTKIRSMLGGHEHSALVTD